MVEEYHAGFKLTAGKENVGQHFNTCATASIKINQQALIYMLNCEHDFQEFLTTAIVLFKF